MNVNTNFNHNNNNKQLQPSLLNAAISGFMGKDVSSVPFIGSALKIIVNLISNIVGKIFNGIFMSSPKTETDSPDQKMKAKASIAAESDIPKLKPAQQEIIKNRFASECTMPSTMPPIEEPVAAPVPAPAFEPASWQPMPEVPVQMQTPVYVAPQIFEHVLDPSGKKEMKTQLRNTLSNNIVLDLTGKNASSMFKEFIKNASKQSKTDEPNRVTKVIVHTNKSHKIEKTINIL